MTFTFKLMSPEDKYINIVEITSKLQWININHIKTIIKSKIVLFEIKIPSSKDTELRILLKDIIQLPKPIELTDH